MRSLITSLLIAGVVVCASAAVAYDVDSLPTITELPDPFLMSNGQRASTVSEWRQRREEISSALQYYEYGFMAPKPLSWSIVMTSSQSWYTGTVYRYNMTMQVDAVNSLVMRLNIYRPGGPGPFPVIVNVGDDSAKSAVCMPRGYMLAAYYHTDLEPDTEGYDVVGPAQAAYPEYDWGSLCVWAWGASRVVDYLETRSDVDRDHVIVRGHSRAGKVALLAGALDERFAMVAPNGAGTGGPSVYRIRNSGSESLAVITANFFSWFQRDFGKFAYKETKLPFDQHFLDALVAPRLLLTTDATGDLWVNPLGNQASREAAKHVFDLLGVGGNIGMHFRSGGHDEYDEDWNAMIDYANLHFFAIPSTRDFDYSPYPSYSPTYSWDTPICSSATPGPVTNFTATPGSGKVTLNWTNPSDSALTTLVIRYKTGSYPTSLTDGGLLVDKTPILGAADSCVHSGFDNATYFYAAFACNKCSSYSSALVSASPVCGPVLAETFDAYFDGALGGQGNWTTTGAASAQVQSAYAKGGTGKSVLMDEVASLGATITNEVSFAPRKEGYYYLSLDTAQDIALGSSGPISATLAVYSSDSTTEIAKLRIQKGKLSVDPNLFASQTVANLAWCNVRIGFNIAARTFDVWFDGTPKFSNYSWKTGSGTDIAKIVISSVRYTGFTTQKAYIDNLALDAAPATIAAIADDGLYTPSLENLHFSFDQAACSGEYRYCIGTTSGGYDTRGWTSCASATDVTAAGLLLSEGQQYFVTVQSGNGSGLWGQSTISDGITVAAGTTIPAAKGLADGQIRALRGKTVSAVFPGCFYVQEPGKPYAIKVISSAAVSPGQTVDVAGEIKGAWAERHLDAAGNAVLTATGPGAITPVSMSNLALGGSALGPLAPGVVDGIGVNNIGLLVRCWGKVSDISGTIYHISDGSQVAITVQAPNLASVPGDGTFALVTGISSMDGSRNRLVLVPPSE